MPSTRRYLIAGLDPTSLDCVSKADLLQMHAAEAPDTDIGFCVTSETTPDAGTYTELSRFLWIKRSTRELYVHDGVSFGLAHATINIPSASITADRLSPSGGSPYYALAVNSAGTEITLQSVPTLIPTNSLSVTQLTKAGVDSFLLTFAGVNTWKSLADAWDILFLNAIPAGSNRDFLYIDGGALAYGSINNVLPNNIIKWNKLEYGTNILTISSGAITIDASLSGNHKVMLTENITSITISNMMMDRLSRSYSNKMELVAGQLLLVLQLNLLAELHQPLPRRPIMGILLVSHNLVDNLLVLWLPMLLCEFCSTPIMANRSWRAATLFS